MHDSPDASESILDELSAKSAELLTQNKKLWQKRSALEKPKQQAKRNLYYAIANALPSLDQARSLFLSRVEDVKKSPLINSKRVSKPIEKPEKFQDDAAKALEGSTETPVDAVESPDANHLKNTEQHHLKLVQPTAAIQPLTNQADLTLSTKQRTSPAVSNVATSSVRATDEDEDAEHISKLKSWVEEEIEDLGRMIFKDDKFEKPVLTNLYGRKILNILQGIDRAMATNTFNNLSKPVLPRDGDVYIYKTGAKDNVMALVSDNKTWAKDGCRRRVADVEIGRKVIFGTFSGDASLKKDIISDMSNCVQAIHYRYETVKRMPEAPNSIHPECQAPTDEDEGQATLDPLNTAFIQSAMTSHTSTESLVDYPVVKKDPVPRSKAKTGSEPTACKPEATKETQGSSGNIHNHHWIKTCDELFGLDPPVQKKQKRAKKQEIRESLELNVKILEETLGQRYHPYFFLFLKPNHL